MKASYDAEEESLISVSGWDRGVRLESGLELLAYDVPMRSMDVPMGSIDEPMA